MICNKEEYFGGLAYVQVQQATDSNGNALVMERDIGIPVAFYPDTGSYDGLTTIFISSSNKKVYIHLSNFSTGAGIAAQTVKGKLYYIPL